MNNQRSILNSVLEEQHGNPEETKMSNNVQQQLKQISRSPSAAHHKEMS